ncbi:3-oxoacyl-(acyl-carrier-protein) synthase [Arenibacter nanhaiticus]|uniref:3-oxoacyl-(Acyl-carrier-protein) synthase n=1 Tax=Arenibacter nanhaiticus TaxID=558155 RepID=A0A1M6JI46_9FLAO|nr:beta-ketoacyl synthase N-terminal-like domain-containing protein [Arenibacter nanhaiticus]SHJ46315.1 3-oxoacyl-(acyl-carrier-protein) synthase [Arenibacter nanhaiticus]
MTNDPISITAIASVSAIGLTLQEAWDNYKKQRHFLQEKQIGDTLAWVASLPEHAKAAIEKLAASDSKYSNLDGTVLFALLVSRMAIDQAGWTGQDTFGINIGSSRGATALFEKYHREFLEENQSSTYASPTTTLGNISSWVAHDLQTQGPEISHSITCSTGLHSVLNGIAWIKGGMANKFLVGGSEAPLTPFTIAQMRALKIYSKMDPNESQGFPCRALDPHKKQNTMVLGEGASVACLEKGITDNALAVIAGIGYATEPLEHNISISTDAICFQRSMKMALGDLAAEEVDVVVMHAPGTIKGDRAEVLAIEKIFGDRLPALTTNKWKLGHTFGTSGMLSVEMAVLMLQHQEFIGVPFVSHERAPKKIRKVMVNAVGFGGNAVSILLSKD